MEQLNKNQQETVGLITQQASQLQRLEGDIKTIVAFMKTMINTNMLNKQTSQASSKMPRDRQTRHYETTHNESLQEMMMSIGSEEELDVDSETKSSGRYQNQS